MTPGEWATCTDTDRMIRWLGRRPGDRKYRLLACAVVRALGDALPFEHQECAKYVEKNADGLLSWGDVAQRVTSRLALYDPGLIDELTIRLIHSDPIQGAADICHWAAALLSHGPRWPHLDRIRMYGEDVRSGWTVPSPTARFAGLVRDVMGDPFQPVEFDPGWRTSTALRLARTIHDSRDFAAAPILADALQDAGCDDDRVLSHLRGPGPHARGCWVLDAVLGKS